MSYPVGTVVATLTLVLPPPTTLPLGLSDETKDQVLASAEEWGRDEGRTLIARLRGVDVEDLTHIEGEDVRVSIAFIEP